MRLALYQPDQRRQCRRAILRLGRLPRRAGRHHHAVRLSLFGPGAEAGRHGLCRDRRVVAACRAGTRFEAGARRPAGPVHHRAATRRCPTRASQPATSCCSARRARGVPAQVHARADLRVRIPHAPGMRSLNVAVAAGIALGGGAAADRRMARGLGVRDDNGTVHADSSGSRMERRVVPRLSPLPAPSFDDVNLCGARFVERQSRPARPSRTSTSPASPSTMPISKGLTGSSAMTSKR